MNRLLWKGVRIVFDTLVTAQHIASKVPGSTLLVDTILDTILGPAEDFTYVSKTAPSSPPPTL